MDELLVETPLGAFGFVGRVYVDRPRPALVVLSGAFPPPGHMHEWVDRFSGVSVVAGKLGTLVDGDIADLEPLRRGLDTFIQRLFPDCPVVTLAASTGCLFTLGLRSQQVIHHVAVEPFFSTAGLWPFLQFAREKLGTNPDSRGVATFLREVFGITADGVTNKDYGDMLARLNTPTDAILGETPLEPQRELPTWPSLTSADDRAKLAGNRFVKIHVAPPGSGHGLELLPEGKKLIDETTLRALQMAMARLRAREGPS